uniref:Uncharacterized protein n=1 Tax=Fagus sylvatica TaxID=28930 RepID=A0A2N9GF27_FAGSY
MAFQVSNSKALILVLAALIFFWMAATPNGILGGTKNVMALNAGFQIIPDSFQHKPSYNLTVHSLSPAPSMETGAGFSTSISAAVMGFSIVFSLLALFKH